MPSPLVHSAVAAAAARYADRPSRRAWVGMLFAANLPDLDLLPGVWMGDPHRFHHGPTHSLAFGAALAALAAAWPWSQRNDAEGYRTRLKFFLFICLLHPLMDMFNDDSLDMMAGLPPAAGIAVAWPFSSARVKPLLPVFPSAILTPDWHGWLAPPNLRIFSADLLIGAAFVLAAELLRRRRRRPLPAEALTALPSVPI